MENKGFKSLKQLHREEIFDYRYEEIRDCIEVDWDGVVWDDEGELVTISNGDVVFVHEPKIITDFAFPYSLEIEGDYEKQYESSKQKVNLDYIIAENTKQIDFMMKMLREKPDPDIGMLYLVKEERSFPQDTRFRVVRFYRSFVELVAMGNRNEAVFLSDIEDRKKIYSAYKKVRKRLVEKIEKLYEESGISAFNIIMYNKD